MEQGRTRVTLLPRERVLVADGQRTPVGIGPTDVVSDGHNLAYVTDRIGNAVLVARLRPRLEITRRVHVPDAPREIALDRARRQLVVLTDRGEVRLTADGRPRPVGAR